VTDGDELRKQVLEYEDLMAEIDKRRNPSSKKPWWESAGVLSSLTAVLTVALTSLAAYYTQKSMKEKDFLTEQSKSNYESEVSTVNAAYVLANETMYWAGERDRLLWGDYRSFSPEQKKILVDSVNASDTKWRRGRAEQRVGLGLLFGNDPVVLGAWDSAVSHLNEYTSCTVARSGCTTLRLPTEKAIETFRDSSVAHVRSARPTLGKR
jgi:hypothetical protein